MRMASHHDLSAPVTPISSSTTSSFFRNRFSNASLLSLSSVRTLLPRYSVVDSSEPSASIPSETATTRIRESLSSAPSSWNTPSAIDPPRYSLLNPRHSRALSSRRASAFEVEGGSREHEFQYSYPIRPKNPWATLYLHTRNAIPGTHSKSLQNQPRIPRFCSCNPITGTVQLDLDTPQNIQLISIKLTGLIILSSHTEGSLPFLNHEFTLWDKSMGDPLRSDNTDSEGAQKKKSDLRLTSGQYSFPFSFPFPTFPNSNSSVLNDSISPFRPHIVNNTLSDDAFLNPDNGPQNAEKPRRTHRFTPASDEPSSPTKLRIQDYPHTQPRHSCASPMPPTFMEKDIDPNVAYDISVRIVHGRFKASSKIKTNIAYLPALEPQPASQMRREAYEAGSLIPCPMDDPQGWFSLTTVTTYGVVKIIYNSLHTKVDCTLYIAQPLSYTRGSVIPCFITIHSDSVEVESLLPSTERPTVRLLRRVWHPTTVIEDLYPENCGDLKNPTWTYTMMPTSDMTLVTHEVGRAHWWTPSKNVVQGPNSRHLEGEIHLSPDLHPSCDFQSFRIEYAVELLSLETSNFKPEVQPPSTGLTRKADNVLASSLVEITTLYRQDEPIPTAYSDPPKTSHKHCVSSEKAV